MNNCQKAQERLEYLASNRNKQWSCAETELSDNDDSLSGSYSLRT